MRLYHDHDINATLYHDCDILICCMPVVPTGALGEVNSRAEETAENAHSPGTIGVRRDLSGGYVA